MAPPVGNSKQFFLWDYEGTLFPLNINRLLVAKYSRKILDFVQEQILTNAGGFQPQHRVFATKRGWFLRPTVKLDPVAEFFFYDFVYRNRTLFRKSPVDTRRNYGFRIVKGEPIPILESYSTFKKAVAKNREIFAHYSYFDVAAYFTRIYHHDLVRWFEDAGADDEDVKTFGKFLRETAAGRSVDCLPQGIYPSKMIGASFLGFLENSSRIRCKQSLRLMDDVWLFDDEQKTLVADFLVAQALLSDRGLCVNEEKSKILEGHDPDADVPSNVDAMKITLLQKRRDELLSWSDYGDSGDEDESEDEGLAVLSEDEQEYLLNLLRQENVPEEDAELVLTLMRDQSSDVMEFIPTLISEFPGLAKRLYYFCRDVEDKQEVASALRNYLRKALKITEYQLFWFGKMVEDYLLKTNLAGELLITLFEHENATPISKAKILEIPEKRFGLADVREEQLRTGHRVPSSFQGSKKSTP